MLEYKYNRSNAIYRHITLYELKTEMHTLRSQILTDFSIIDKSVKQNTPIAATNTRISYKYATKVYVSYKYVISLILFGNQSEVFC